MVSTERFTARQLGIVFLIASVQFVNVLDFVMVMPLGPDFARSLGFSEASVGYVGGSYTAAAAVAGLVGATFLDRFDRRRALFVAMLGLVTGTALGGFATGLPTLIAVRVVAGAFGGPATALAIAIVSDAVPNALRGRALGIVFGAFSVASVLGIPAGLWLAELHGWRTPFFGVAALGALISVFVVAMLPPMRAHLDNPEPPVATLELVRRPLVQKAYLLVAFVMMAGFIVIPNISGYVQLNLGVSRPELKYLYLAGGIGSFTFMQLAGRLVDRHGSFVTGLVGCVVFAAVVFLGFWVVPPVVSPLWLFVAFMSALALRNVAYSTVVTKVPEPAARARFQSLSSAVQHASAAVAAFLSAQLLERVPRPGVDGAFVLTGMGRVATLSIALTAVIPVLLWWVETGVLRRAAEPLIPQGAVR